MGWVLHIGEVDGVHVRLKGVHDPQIFTPVLSNLCD